ncbi:MAG: hypothetical protein COA70_04310 [Planctomycetota bacterium]|nr:MAG: hypothetical protein COA70_04310 [Planctomycetota bacterium]
MLVFADAFHADINPHTGAFLTKLREHFFFRVGAGALINGEPGFLRAAFMGIENRQRIQEALTGIHAEYRLKSVGYLNICGLFRHGQNLDRIHGDSKVFLNPLESEEQRQDHQDQESTTANRNLFASTHVGIITSRLGRIPLESGAKEAHSRAPF